MAFLLLSGGLFCGVGLWDDRVGLRPRTKLISQIVAALPAEAFGLLADASGALVVPALSVSVRAVFDDGE